MSRPQPVKQVQDLSEQSFGDNDLRELECDVAAMSSETVWPVSVMKALTEAGWCAST